MLYICILLVAYGGVRPSVRTVTLPLEARLLCCIYAHCWLPMEVCVRRSVECRDGWGRSSWWS